MELENITVRFCHFGKFENSRNDGEKHIKELPWFSVVQATTGYYSFGLNGRQQKDMKPGECFIAPALARQEITHHTDRQSGLMSARWVFMDVIVNGSIPFDFAYSLPNIPEPEACKNISNIFDRAFASNTIIDHKICCYEILKILLPYAVENTNRELRIETAVSYIHEHFHGQLTVDEIAASVNTSAPNLYRLFKKAVGVSPIEYCNSLKLSHACMLLEQSTHSIEKISEMCGVSDPFYFSKMFKKKFGVSPASYRKQYAK